MTARLHILAAVAVFLACCIGVLVRRDYLWLVLVIGSMFWLSAVLLLRDIRDLKSQVRARRGACPRCGYDLRASPDRCPECGRRADAADAPSPTPGRR